MIERSLTAKINLGNEKITTHRGRYPLLPRALGVLQEALELAKVLADSPEREDRVLAMDLAKETFVAAQREGLVKTRPDPDRGRERYTHPIRRNIYTNLYLKH